MNKLVLLLMFFCVFSVYGQSGLDSLRLVVPVGNKMGSESAEFSPDGKYIISASVANEIIIYEFSSGKEILKFMLPHQSASSTSKVMKYGTNGNAVFISPNIFEDFLSDTAVIVDFNDLNIKYLQISSNEISIDNVFFNSDGDLIISSSYYSQIFSLGNLIKLRDFNGNSIFSPSGKEVLTVYNDSTLGIWDKKTGNEIKLNKKETGNVKYVAYSPNGKNLIISTYDESVRIWDLELGKVVKTLVENIESKNKDNQIDNVINKIIINRDKNQLLIIDRGIYFDIWDIVTFEKLKVFESFDKFDAKSFSPDGKMLVTVSNKNLARVYDIESGIEIMNIDLMNEILQIDFSRDSKFLIISSFEKVRIYDIKTGDEVYKLNGRNFSLGPLDCLTICDFRTIAIYNLKTGLKIKQINAGGIWASNVYFSKDSKIIFISEFGTGFEMENGSSTYLPKILGVQKVIYGRWKNFTEPTKVISQDGKNYITYFENCFGIFDASHNSLKHKISCSDDTNFGFTKYAEFSLDGSLAVHEINNQEVKIFDVLSGKELYSIETEGPVRTVVISPNNKYILINYMNSSIPKVYEIITGKEIFKLSGHEGILLDALYLPNGKFIVTTGYDFKTIIWDAETGKQIYNRFQLENNNWFIQLPNSPYYMCSKDASKMLHYVTPSLKVIGFEQLDPIYNRPDIVMDSIGRYFGNNDRGMIEEYRKAWEKRIERLGLKDQMDKLGKGEISVPNAEIENVESIAYENTEGTIKIDVKANDPKYKLRRFNVWVNEVPLYGSNGLSIAGLDKNAWDTTLSVPISLGDNKIQVSVMNELGLENFKYPLYVKYSSEKVVPKTHFIGIAVDKFDNGKNLSFCVKDINDLSAYFSKLPNSSIKLLTEKEVNKENIAALKEYLKTTSVHDRVIISCSSHGILDSARNFYLATHDTDFESPEKNGISFELLDGLLDEIPARKKLLLLDACNSGENDEGYAKMDNSSTDGRGANVKIGDEIVKESNFKKMKELFVNVRNNSGAYIISATGGIQKALEGEAVMLDGKPLENGSFTYAVLEYLKENKSNTTKLTVNQLKKYVEQRVVELTNGKQTPTSRQETMEIDWDLH